MLTPILCLIVYSAWQRTKPKIQAYAMSYTVPDNAIDAEILRHRYLSEISDPESLALFSECGLVRNWRCLEVGTGAGSLALTLADLVGAAGEVVATDIDLRLVERLHTSIPKQLSFVKHDVQKTVLRPSYFDLVHGRALLQHLPEPERGVHNMAKSLKPDGWLVIEDVDFSCFDNQVFNGAFAELVVAMHELRQSGSGAHKADMGLKLPNMMRTLGLKNIDMRGHAWHMRGNTPSMEWLTLALEWGLRSVVDDAVLKQAIKEARQPDFGILSPMHLSVWGQIPPQGLAA